MAKLSPAFNENFYSHISRPFLTSNFLTYPEEYSAVIRFDASIEYAPTLVSAMSDLRHIGSPSTNDMHPTVFAPAYPQARLESPSNFNLGESPIVLKCQSYRPASSWKMEVAHCKNDKRKKNAIIRAKCLCCSPDSVIWYFVAGLPGNMIIWN